MRLHCIDADGNPVLAVATDHRGVTLNGPFPMKLVTPEEYVAAGGEDPWRTEPGIYR